MVQKRVHAARGRVRNLRPPPAGELRYVANLDAEGNASVGLEPVAADHPFCNINLTDNIVQFETERYSANPLVIQGPGAGPEVTAAGVFADLLRLANFLSTGEGYV